MHDYVTYVDKASEKKIIERLSEILPEAGYVVEEKTVTKHSDDYNWIVDPLDGTTNYIHGVPCYSVSIALMKRDKVVVGVVYEVNLVKRFYAWQGGGHTLTAKEIHVSSTAKVTDSLLATGFPYYDYSALEKVYYIVYLFSPKLQWHSPPCSAAPTLFMLPAGVSKASFNTG